MYIYMYIYTIYVPTVSAFYINVICIYDCENVKLRAAIN